MVLTIACSAFSWAETTALSNEKVATYIFLNDIALSNAFPSKLAEDGKQILMNLCTQIENDESSNATEVYSLTHTATQKFNELDLELQGLGSEIDSFARENIAKNIDYVLQSYGFYLDLEEAMAPREW